MTDKAGPRAIPFKTLTAKPNRARGDRIAMPMDALEWICQLLGIEDMHVTQVTLRCSVDSVPRIVIEHIAHGSDADAITVTVKQLAAVEEESDGT